jgi:superfamily II DNA/RNA helicase
MAAADACLEYTETPSPFSARALEVVGELFALEVDALALLVVPAEMPVRRLVWELRQLGVPARGLNVQDDASSVLRPHSPDGARLLVATEATTRGLDLWGLSHVFVYGVPLGRRRVDSFVHLAGRVGRRGGRRARGTVVTVAMGREKATAVAGVPARLVKEEVDALGRMYRAAGIRPVRHVLYE